MTYYELFFWIGVPIVFIGSIFLCAAVEDGVPLIFNVFYISIGGMVAATMSESGNTIVTSTTIKNVKSSNIVNGELILLLDNAEVVRYNKYADVEKFKNVEEVYYQYLFKKNPFGVDGNSTKVIPK
jgi:hypothetical protein